MIRPWLTCLLLGCCLCLSAGEITGSVTVKSRKGKDLDIKTDRVVVYVQSAPTKIPKSLVDAEYHMDTRDKQYTPRMMAVPVGATVKFKNFDPIRHNVFSVSGKNRFDGGLFKKNETYVHTFKHKGLVRVYCNVHHDMNSIILIADNPHFTYVDKSGNFVLEDLPDGDFKLSAFHRKTGRKSLSVSVVNGVADPVRLDLVQAKKRKRHLNKHGKPYKKSRSRRY